MNSVLLSLIIVTLTTFSTNGQVTTTLFQAINPTIVISQNFYWSLSIATETNGEKFLAIYGKKNEKGARLYNIEQTDTTKNNATVVSQFQLSSTCSSNVIDTGLRVIPIPSAIYNGFYRTFVFSGCTGVQLSNSGEFLCMKATGPEVMTIYKYYDTKGIECYYYARNILPSTVSSEVPSLQSSLNQLLRKTCEIETYDKEVYPFNNNSPYPVTVKKQVSTIEAQTTTIATQKTSSINLSVNLYWKAKSGVGVTSLETGGEISWDYFTGYTNNLIYSNTSTVINTDSVEVIVPKNKKISIGVSQLLKKCTYQYKTPIDICYVYQNECGSLGSLNFDITITSSTNVIKIDKWVE